MIERKPYPFFFSVEFLTVLVKVSTVSTPFLIAIATTGFNLPNLLALLFSGILTGCLMAAKELEIHQNLYTPNGIAGRDKHDAIENIKWNVATEIASNTEQTISQVLENTVITEIADVVVKPSLGNAGAKLVAKLLGRIF